MKIIKLYDPTGAAGRETWTSENGESITSILMREFPDGVDTQNVGFVLNGSPLKLPEFNDAGEMVAENDLDQLTRVTTSEDVLGIVLETKEPTTILLVASLVLSVGAAIYAYSAIGNIAVPDSGKTSGTNNQLYGQENAPRPYDAIPDIYGTIVSYPDLMASEAIRYYDQNKVVIRQFMAIGVGQYDINPADVKLGGTLLSQIPESIVTIIEPVAGITTVPEYAEQFSVLQIEGQELTLDGSTSIDLYQPASGGLDYGLNYIANTDTGVLYGPAGLEQVFSVGDTVKIKCRAGKKTMVGTYVISAVGTYTSGGQPASYIDLANASTGTNQYWSQYSFPRQSDNNQENGDYAKKIDALGGTIGPYDTTVAGQGFLIDIEAPQGVPLPVEFDVTYEQIDKPGGVVTVAAVTETITMTSPSFTEFVTVNQTFVIDVTASEIDRRFYRVSILRTTPDYSGTPLIPDVTKWERLASYTNYASRDFKNVTVLDVKIPQTAQSISPRKNKVNVEVTRKTVSYNDTTGAVVETLTASNKFADAVLHEYYKVFELDYTSLDLDELYAIQESIDANDSELGEFNYTFDDKDMGLEDRIEIICNAARVQTFRDGRTWRFVRDEAKSFVSGIITRRDLSADRSFGKTWASRLPTEADSVRVEYVDKDLNKKAYVYRSIDLAGVISTAPGRNIKSIVLTGCRSEVQAVNRAELEIRRMLYDFWTVSDTLLSQGNLYDVGDLVRYNDTIKKDVFSGEIVALVDNGSGTIIAKISELVELPGLAGDYEITYTDDLGDPHGPFTTVVSGAGNNFVTSTDGFADAYVSDGLTSQLGSRYIITKTEEREGELYIVKEKKPNGDGGQVDVVLAQYLVELFAFD